MNNRKIPIALTREQWNVIANALGEMPFKAVAPLFQEMQLQMARAAQDEISPAPAAAQAAAVAPASVDSAKAAPARAKAA